MLDCSIMEKRQEQAREDKWHMLEHVVAHTHLSVIASRLMHDITRYVALYTEEMEARTSS